MTDKFLLVANWKTYTPEISNFKFPPASTAGGQISNLVELAIAPQFPEIEKIPPEFSRCAQDVSQFADGAHTGEVTARELNELNTKYCLVGHSETRQIKGVTTEIVGEKILQLTDQRIIPIVCASSEEDIPGEILKSPPWRDPAAAGQVQDDIKILIMYEPKTAISTPGDFHPESPENVKRTLAAWKNKYDARFLYGGSINPKNAQVYAQIENVSGFVIGQASLDPISLKEIYDAVSKIKHS